MSWDHWWFLTKETLRPETGTWIMILLPFLIALIMIIYYRGKTPQFKGAWRELGRRWVVTGLTGLILSIVCYSGIVYKNCVDNYQEQYVSRLKENSKDLLNKLDFSLQMQWLVENCPNITELKECILDKFRVMPKVERHKFMSTIHSMPDRKSFVYTYSFEDPFFQDLYWPPERIKDFIKKNRGIKPGDPDTLKFTAKQEELYKNQDKEALHNSLTNEQWACLIGQFITKMDQDLLASFIKQAVQNDNIGSENGTIKNIRNGDRLSLSQNYYVTKGLIGVIDQLPPPKACAYLAGVPQEFEVFNFFISYYNWIRELPYLLIYLVVGIVMIISGGLMMRQGKKPLLNI